MATHPYKSLPSTAFWRSAVTGLPPGDVDPVGSPKFTLSRTDRVATAGSCFAQHIARHLARAGFNYMVTERAHPLIAKHIADQYGYGLFTARYANIYTTRQMLQLLLRAYGLFTPADDIWPNPDGSLTDPFRPQIQPGGFRTMAEFRADRAQHFEAVRRMVETLDCFVFTLGLTETWAARADGATYPLCPGTVGGSFDPQAHAFHNLTVAEILDDLAAIRDFVKTRNPEARFILTVSPVPLVASASGDHVLSATTFSKSILRAAAGEFANANADVAYFPSYEIITGSFNRGNYFAEDLRSVREEGVSHAMRLFLRRYGSVDDENPEAMAATVSAAPSGPIMQDLVKAVCEEEALARFG